MKSFFKKLAFVMAMAMVVSMAAPAAQRAAAAETVRICYQGTNTEVASVVMEVGQEDVVDLCFKGAPSDWKNYKWSWSSSNENVATVDKNGVITPVANGATTITLVTDCDVVATPVVVTVGTVKSVLLGTSKTDTFTGKEIQIGDTSVDLNFYGIADWGNGRNYRCQWVSTDMQVATVNNVGRITPVAAGETAIWFLATNTVTQESYAAKVDVTIVDTDVVNYGFFIEQVDMETIELTFAEGTDMSEVTADDFVFMAVSGEGIPANEIKADTIVADKNIVTVTFAEGTLTDGTLLQIICHDQMAGVSIAKSEENLTPKQLTATKVLVQFVNKHSFDQTGLEEGTKATTVKVYRKFTTEEMAKMGNQSGFQFDEEGNGYQAYYVKGTGTNESDATEWIIEGYDAFVDGATYTAVYGDNETSSTLNGVRADFIAYVGKVTKIKVTSLGNATVENNVEPAVPAALVTRLYNSHDIDLTDYYGDAEDLTDYEIVGDVKIEVSISNNEVTFDEPGTVQVRGTYTFYDEDKEEDVSLWDVTSVTGSPYSSYKIEKIYKWTLEGGSWNEPKTNMIAGDSDQLYVIVVDNRGNYYTNYVAPANPADENSKVRTKDGYRIPGTDQWVAVIGDGNDDTPFEQYGYELVFDSLDPDSLLVDDEGEVESYKQTKSFAVVSYRNTDTDNAKLHEIGIMGIEVKAPRTLKTVKYNQTSFTVLETTEGEKEYADDIKENGYYNSYPEFKTTATLKVWLKDQYDGDWPSVNAADKDKMRDVYYTVTTTRREFQDIAEDIARYLNNGETYAEYPIDASMFEDAGSVTSVSFKIKENVTGNVQTVTVKLDIPKYVDDNKNEVYVDPSRAILEAGDVPMYTNLISTAKLFQVSKASQKIGFFRIGDLEQFDEKEDKLPEEARGKYYYVANDLPKNFVTKVNANGEEAPTFVSLPTASGSSLVFDSTSTPPALQVGDYVLVVTDPSGKVFPVQRKGGNGMSFAAGSELGIVPNSDSKGIGYDIVVAAIKGNGEMEYAPTGTYRVNVYRISNIVNNTSNGVTVSKKYNTVRVASDSFVVTKDLKDVVFYHQKYTKDVEVSSFNNADDVLKAISETMTFRINGQEFEVNEKGEAKYWSFVKYDNYGSYDYHLLGVKVHKDEDGKLAIDYKIQNNGARAVIDTVTFEVYTPAGGYYLSKVKVNRSVNAED